MKEAKVVAIVQARMGSSRFPGKVMERIGTKTLLSHVLDRACHSSLIDEVVVATSDSHADDPIAEFCESEGLRYFRGSESDVLDRYYKTAQHCRANVIVRLTGDCPLLDPDVIDGVIQKYFDSKADYASNVEPYTFPEGLDTEVFSFGALETAWREAKNPADREHVATFIRNSPRFKKAALLCPLTLTTPYHWSVDRLEDLDYIRRIYDKLGSPPSLSFKQVLKIIEEMDERPESRAVNEGYLKSIFTEAKAESAPKQKVTRSQELLVRSRARIPGASQTMSKAFHQHVQGISPVFLERGAGCRVWDVDGNEYVDYVQGLLANILGYANPEVNAVVQQRISQGHSFSLSHPVEIELAETLCRIIPCAEKVRFGKNGSDSTAGAIRAARSFTKKDRVAVCGYHGWQDWYIGSTSRHWGVPEAVSGLTHPFPYNDTEALEKLLNQFPGEWAAVIMEPVNFTAPKAGYLEAVRSLTQKKGIVLIFDEMCTGLQFGLGGAQKYFGVTPDLACFGKALGNGFPISCVVGKSEVMQEFERVFFSFTLAGETASIVAALKVIEILEQTEALKQMEAFGRELQNGFNYLSREAGLFPRFECVGYPWWSLLKFRNTQGQDSFLERTLFQQELVKRGVLQLVTHNLSSAHDGRAIQTTLKAYAGVFKTLAEWLADPSPERFLEGPLIQPVFQVR